MKSDKSDAFRYSRRFRRQMHKKRHPLLFFTDADRHDKEPKDSKAIKGSKANKELKGSKASSLSQFAATAEPVTSPAMAESTVITICMILPQLLGEILDMSPPFVATAYSIGSEALRLSWSRFLDHGVLRRFLHGSVAEELFRPFPVSIL
jgi:hypothetical protein